MASELIARKSGEDGVCDTRPSPDGVTAGELVMAALFLRRAARAPRARLMGVWMPRSNGSETSGGAGVAFAIAAAAVAAQKRSLNNVGHLLRNSV